MYIVITDCDPYPDYSDEINEKPSEYRNITCWVNLAACTMWMYGKSTFYHKKKVWYEVSLGITSYKWLERLRDIRDIMGYERDQYWAKLDTLIAKSWR